MAATAEFVDRSIAWTGNNAAISELSEQELRRFAANGHRLLLKLEKDSITLAGDDPSVLLK